MTPSDLPEFVLVDGLWIDRRIPNCHVPTPNGLCSSLGHLEK